MEPPALLDLNVLIALFDPDHVHHEPAHDWFAQSRHRGWATSPLTENGLVRVLSNPRYGATVQRAGDILTRLASFCESGHHHFWAGTVSLREETLFARRFISGHRQLTDIYLLAIALKHGGRLATFDRTIPHKAVIGARRDTLEVIGPAG
ncbi:MAG TPA: TA system VapC family ribonuclease toxin [Vicinamibacterales bacterium]|nr:TA system VapC family ribonuclease toxin [Vicinamibacterales bacterium]